MVSWHPAPSTRTSNYKDSKRTDMDTSSVQSRVNFHLNLCAVVHNRPANAFRAVV